MTVPKGELIAQKQVNKLPKSKAKNTISYIDSLTKVYNVTHELADKHIIAFTIGEQYWNLHKLNPAEIWLQQALKIDPNLTNLNNVVNGLDLLSNLYLREVD